MASIFVFPFRISLSLCIHFFPPERRYPFTDQIALNHAGILFVVLALFVNQLLAIFLFPELYNQSVIVGKAGRPKLFSNLKEPGIVSRHSIPAGSRFGYTIDFRVGRIGTG